MEMTLTRALNEVKLIEKKIMKYAGSDLTWVSISKNGKIGPRAIDAQKLESVVKENKSSFVDLVTRRNMIKRRILTANNSTTLTVDGVMYSIAEAIDLKSFIETEKIVYRTMIAQIRNVDANFVDQQEAVDDLVERTITNALQGDGKKDPTLVSGIEKSVRDNNKIVLEDPCGIREWATNKLESVDTFLNEIDFSLSEINATTKISVD